MSNEFNKVPFTFDTVYLCRKIIDRDSFSYSHYNPSPYSSLFTASRVRQLAVRAYWRMRIQSFLVVCLTPPVARQYASWPHCHLCSLVCIASVSEFCKAAVSRETLILLEACWCVKVSWGKLFKSIFVFLWIIVNI